MAKKPAAEKVTTDVTDEKAKPIEKELTPQEVQMMKELLARQTVEWRILEGFREPFPEKAVKWKPKMVKGNRALAMPYVDARLIMDRLDEVVGCGRWETEYMPLPDGSVVCHLSVKFGEEWITKCDVGSPSEQPDIGDRIKAAFSDSIKRAAVQFGISRYLYRLSACWVDYDPVKKLLQGIPHLPDWAVPKHAGKDLGAYGDFEEEETEVPQPRPKPPVESVSDKKDEKKDSTPKTQGDWIRFWNDILGGCKDADDLNKCLSGFKDIQDKEVKQFVWDHVRTQAELVGWKYDSAKKQFSGAAKTK